MKNLKIILGVFVCLFLAQSVMGQSKDRNQNNNNKEIVGLKLEQKSAMQLKKFNSGIFKIDSDNVLIPAKGYTIYFLEKIEEYFITDESIQKVKIRLGAGMSGNRVKIGRGIYFSCRKYDDACTKCEIKIVNNEVSCHKENCDSCFGDLSISSSTVLTPIY